MAKFYGKIGYADAVETSPGVWTEVITEKSYSGEVLRNTRNIETADKLIDNLVISNRLSILVDPYALKHFHLIRYVDWMGALWKVTHIEVQYPRLILNVGGVYNGN